MGSGNPAGSGKARVRDADPGDETEGRKAEARGRDLDDRARNMDGTWRDLEAGSGVPRIRASIGPSFNFLFVRGHVWTVVQVHQRSDSDVTCGR